MEKRKKEQIDEEKNRKERDRLMKKRNKEVDEGNFRIRFMKNEKKEEEEKKEIDGEEKEGTD